MRFRGLKPRYIVFAAWPVLLSLLLVWQNDNVSALYNFQRAIPFLLTTLGKTALVALLVIQHPDPPSHVSRWQFWKWLDPVTIILIFMFLDSASYYASLWGNQSGRFTYHPVAFDALRVSLVIVGYVVLVVAQEMIYRALEARRLRRLKRKPVYGMDGEEAQ